MWNIPPQNLSLQSNQVHLWKLGGKEQLHLVPEIKLLLSEDEIDRASRFRFDKHRNNFILARGMLRRLLANYLGEAPESINFHYTSFNQPVLSKKSHLQFNVSYSNGIIIYGFTQNDQIGVDIEFNKKEVEVEQMARHFFSENEARNLLQLPSNQHLQAFYNCWTRKEAFIKAKGAGLSLPLDQFEVSFLPEDDASLLSINWDMQDVKNWKMINFNCGEDYTCAAIVHNTKAEFSFYNSVNN